MKKLALTIITALLSTHGALASTGELYGYGSRASALGNTMLGGITDPFATYYNPAANSANPGLQISLGTAYYVPHFLKIEGVTIQNSATSDRNADVVGNVDTENYLDHFGQAIGLSLNLGEAFKNLTVGLTAAMPLARVAYLDTGDPFKPEYYNYRSRTQRPQIYAAMSAQPFKNFYFGTGIAIATNLSATATLFTTGSDGKVSSARLASTIKPSAAPYFSLYAKPDPMQLGLVLRLPNKYKITMDTNAQAHLLSGASNIPLVLNSTSTIYYDPLEIDLGASYRIREKTWVTLELDWYQYKAFEGPTLSLTDTGSLPDLKDSIATTPTMRNIFVPRIGVERQVDKAKVRAGYYYRPSPVKDNSGTGNLVDPSQHVLTAGVGFDLKEIKLTERQIFLDIHAQYHHLVKSHVSKSAGTETGSSGTKIGAPGYDIGGYIYGGGFSLTANF